MIWWTESAIRKKHLCEPSAHMDDAQRTAGVELSDDALLLILSQLRTTDLCRAACVSRQWRHVCGTKTLWTDINLYFVGAQRVTHKRLLNLVARAQGGLRALEIARGSPNLSEVTLAAIVQQSPDLAFILGFSKVCTKSVEHVFGADSAQELLDRLVQPDVSLADVIHACLFLQATGDFENIYTGTTLVSLPVANGLIGQLEMHASNRRLVLSIQVALIAHVFKIRPVAGIEIWRALCARIRAVLTTHIDD
jgi:F-box-like